MTRRNPLPEFTLKSIARAPDDRPVSLLIRHAHREPIHQGVHWTEARLTEEGIAHSQHLGKLLGNRQVVRIAASPVHRCVTTAEHIAEHAGIRSRIETHWELRAGPFFASEQDEDDFPTELSVFQYVDAFLGKLPAPPGMRNAAAGVSDLVRFLLPDGLEPGWHISVTHDALIAVTVGQLLGLPVQGEHWPGFLEGLVLWRDGGKLGLAWRGERYEVPLRPEGTDTVG